MDLFCIPGHDKCGEQKFVFPRNVQLQSLDLYIWDNNSNTENPFHGIKENVENATHIGVKSLEKEFSIQSIAHLVHQTIERNEDSNLYFFGNNDEKVFFGPVLQVISPSTYGKITRNKVVFFNQNPIDSNGKYLQKRDKEVGVTQELDDKNLMIVIARNGCIAVLSGGFLIFDLVLVVVKSNGEYFTISGGRRNVMKLKAGLHLILLLEIENQTVPVLFIRRPEQIREIDVKQVMQKIESKEQSVSLKSVKSIDKSEKLEIIDKSESKSEVITDRKDTEIELKIERLLVNDLSDANAFIPNYVFEWIKNKGIEVERGGGPALLAMGHSSVVRRARSANSTPIAVKIIVSEMDGITRSYTKAPQELVIAKSADHKNVIKTFDIFCVITELTNRTEKMYSFLVMELTSTETLEKIIKREGKMSEDRARQVFRQVISGVAYLHSHHIAHCHLRLNNCIVDKDIIKLCDFSRADNIFVSKSAELKEHKWLSVKYMPPEFFDSPNALDLLKVDVWMCACILYSLLTGNTSPFGAITRKDWLASTDLFQAFRSKQNDRILNDMNVSPKAQNLLSDMFKTDPNQRANAQSVSANEWFQ